MGTAAMAVALIAVGAALSPVVMLGLLGLPMVLVGAGMLAIVVSRTREAHGASSWTEALGLFLGVPASFGVMVSALYSAGLAWKHMLGAQRPTARIYDLHAGDLAMAAAAWLLLPSLITLGIRLRTGWSGGRLVGWWLLTFSPQPAAVAGFTILAASGFPISA